MILNVIIDDQKIPIEVPDHLLQEAEEFFQKMDTDMDQGWQMSRAWVDQPDVTQRCQIAADRILTAFHTQNRAVATMMAAYILKKMTGANSIEIDTGGDMTQTLIHLG